jgi:hypothetical protein
MQTAVNHSSLLFANRIGEVAGVKIPVIVFFAIYFRAYTRSSFFVGDINVFWHNNVYRKRFKGANLSLSCL